MADIFTPEKRSQVMASIRSTGNMDTELKLMQLLREAGIRGWRRHAQIVIRHKPAIRGAKAETRLKVRPDFVFWRARLAVFVDGCFWHGCPRHGTQPKQNGEFWLAKIQRNQKRDRKVVRELKKADWRVLRIWSCALAPRLVMRSLGRVQRALDAGLSD